MVGERQEKDDRERGREGIARERVCVCERQRQNLNLNLFLFYNGYKLGRMPLFILPLIQNYNLSTTEKYSSNY